MISIYHLEIFVAVVDKGSYSAAADALHMTQPAISQQIRALEQQYNAKLFSRAGSHMELTNAGHALLEPARELLRQALKVEDDFTANVGTVRGRIIVGSSVAPAEYITPLLFQQFKTRYDNVQLTFSALNEDKLVEALLDRTLHVGLVGTRPRQREIQAHMLMSDELQLIAPLSHPFFARAGHTDPSQPLTVTPDELRKQPFITRETGSSSRRIAESALRSVGLNFHDLDVVGEFSSAEMVQLAVEAGLGISFVSSLVARRFAGKVGLLRVEGLQMSREVYLIRDADRNHSPAQHKFWEYVTSPDAAALLTLLQGRPLLFS